MFTLFSLTLSSLPSPVVYFPDSQDSAEPSTQLVVARAPPAAPGRTVESPSALHSRRRRRRMDFLAPSPRRFAFSSSPSFPAPPSPSTTTRPLVEMVSLPDAAVEVVLDFLPAEQALAMMARSRATDRVGNCSKYALSRMDKIVTGLAAAEDAFHQVRTQICMCGHSRTTKKLQSIYSG